MVALARKAPSGDFVELNSIAFGLHLAGPPVGQLSKLDFAGLKEDATLVIVGHGSPGSSGDYDADGIAKLLLHTETGLKKAIKQIVFTSCSAGKGVEDVAKDEDSVAGALAKLLGEKFSKINIRGSRGVCVKAIGLETDTEYVVYDPDVTVSLPDGDTESAAGATEDIYRAQFKPDELSAEAIKALKTTKPTIEEQAKASQAATQPSYKAFIAALREPSKDSLLAGLANHETPLSEEARGRLAKRLEMDAVSNEQVAELAKAIIAKKKVVLDKPMTAFPS